MIVMLFRIKPIPWCSSLLEKSKSCSFTGLAVYFQPIEKSNSSECVHNSKKYFYVKYMADVLIEEGALTEVVRYLLISDIFGNYRVSPIMETGGYY